MTTQPSDAAPPSTLLERLRAETASQHAQLEATVDLLRPGVTRERYARFLSVLWQFHAAVEQQLAALPGLPSVVADLAQRYKSELLRQDLVALGAWNAESRRSGNRRPAPILNSLDRALGAMYVLEGSTLGGQVLYRHLSGLLPETLAEASSFLRCYGASTGRMWNAFRTQLERAAPGLDAEAVIEVARESFVVLMDWFVERDAAPPERLLQERSA